ncbi:MAG: DEAD/DEAH box helicase, partial [Gorillibacterium sp.]|nr:DEAD/DEAH box helicase [Gorillibacterium sp.]
ELVKLLGEGVVEFLLELQKDARVIELTIAGEERFICSNEQEFYRDFPERPLSIDFVLRRFTQHRIAFTPDDMSARYDLSLEQSREIIAKWREAKQLERAPFAESSEEELWTASKVAARIMRFSLDEFRKQAEPIPTARYTHILADQLGLSVSPMNTLLEGSGSDQLRQVLAKLEGIFLPKSHWESYILPARISGYRSTDLDLLCSSGEVRWVGKREDGEKEGRVAFFLAESKELYSPFMNKTTPTRHPELLAQLQQRGASFLTSLAREMNQLPSETLDCLIDLVWEGNVANDQFAPLRLHSTAVATKNIRAGKFQSGLGRWYALTSQGRDRVSVGAARRIPNGEDPAAAAWVKHLLARFTILTREIACIYSPYSWDDLYGILKRLEDWGMLTRGYFVAGLSTMQYAEKAAIERMRSNSAFTGATKNLMLCAADPANPFGTILAWPEHSLAAFSRKSSHYLLLNSGRWELWLENGGKRIMELTEDDPRGKPTETGINPLPPLVGEDRLKDALRSLLQWSRLKKVKVEQWNGVRTAESSVAPVLERLGAERDRDAYVFWPSSFHSSK